MFDIGWSEMLVILVVALIVIGPKDLPRVARNVGRWVGKARAMAREFQSQLEDMARETELDKVKDEIEKAGRTDFKRSIEKTIDPDDEFGRAFDPNAETKSAKARSRSPRKPATDKAAPDKATGPKGPEKAVPDKIATQDEVPARAGAEEPGAEPAATAKPSPQVTTDRERVPAETS